MITLNLKAENQEQQKVKSYLEENASEILADKINNGVKITKDNKTLINKKDLNGFMTYACSEAKKLAEKQNSICVSDSTVYGWAVHYFEEDEIEGKLYNEDGTEYHALAKEIKPIQTNKPEIKKNNQASFFDLPEDISSEEIEEDEEELEDDLQSQIIEIDNKKVDMESGEIIEEKRTSSVDNDFAKMIAIALDYKVEVR